MSEPTLETRVVDLEKQLSFALRALIDLAATVHAIRDYTPREDDQTFDREKSQHEARVIEAWSKRHPDVSSFLNKHT